MPASALTAFGPSAGSALSVTPPTGNRLATEENGTVACPLMWSTVAPLNEEELNAELGRRAGQALTDPTSTEPVEDVIERMRARW